MNRHSITIANTILPNFEPYEVISYEVLWKNLFNNKYFHNVHKIVWNEIYKIIILKLQYGERILLLDNNINEYALKYISNIANKYNVNLYIDNETILLYKNYIDNTKMEYIPIMEHIAKMNLPNTNLLSWVKDNGFEGISVFGDVHGNYEDMNKAVKYSLNHNNLIIFLGDVVDYGTNNVKCLELLYDLMINNQAISVIGNHEDKLIRWYEQYQRNDVTVMVSSSMQNTVNEIMNLNGEQKREFDLKFRFISNNIRNHYNIGNSIFTHAAVLNSMFDTFTSTLTGKAKSYALYGEIEPSTRHLSHYPKRLYNWINDIPKNKQVFIGHDVRNTVLPIIVKNDKDSSVYFLDCGCSKGGILAGADLTIDVDDLVFRNFIRI